MKTRLVSVVMMAMVVLGAVAQPRPKGEVLTPEARASKQTEMLQKRLKLTDDQMKKVTEINMRYAQNMEDLRKEMMKASEYKYKKDQEMEKVLTADQFREYLFMKEKMKNRFANMREQSPDKFRKYPIGTPDKATKSEK